MIELLKNLPQQVLTYHIALLFTVAFIMESAIRLKELRWGFAGLVFCTIGLWYFVDPVYRPEDYEMFSAAEKSTAYFQVLLFLLTFRLCVELFVPPVSSRVLRSFDPTAMTSSGIVQLLMTLWGILFFIGVARMNFDVLGALFPLKARAAWDAQLWARPRFGGSLSFLISACDYSYQLVCAGFGLIAVATQNRRVRGWMLVMIALTWPVFLLSGARHRFLAVIMPSILAILIMKPWSRQKQVAFLAAIAVSLNFAFLIVIQYRDKGIDQFFASSTTFTSDEEKEEQKHLGLNMPQELMYINRYQEQGLMKVVWGANYYENAVNFIPRAIWKGKPFPGGDFSILRVGYHKGQVAATISMGLIGQGVANFGPWLGPAIPALILTAFAFWTCQLPHRGNRFLRICLILIIFGKIPNLGRDITLFTLWPVVFGYIGLRLYESNKPAASSARNVRKQVRVANRSRTQ